MIDVIECIDILIRQPMLQMKGTLWVQQSFHTEYVVNIVALKCMSNVP